MEVLVYTPKDLRGMQSGAVLADTTNARRLLLVELGCEHEERAETKWDARSSHLLLAFYLQLCHADPRAKPINRSQLFRH